MQLSPRLKLIADQVKHGSVLADIGTDHGYIPVYCVSEGICPSALAMDVNPQPLDKAKENIALYGLENSIETRLSNGLAALVRDEADTIVIAGMGGLLMMNILKDGDSVLTDKTNLILQPMLAQKELRQYLYENGFTIDREFVCREDNKFYNIICARKTGQRDDSTVLLSKTGEASPSLAELIIGKNIGENSPGVYVDYLDYKIGVCNKIINGMKKSKSVDEKELAVVIEELEIFEKERKRFCEG